MKYGELTLGQIEATVNRLGGMEGVKRFLSGNAEAVLKNHLINCDADPFVPDGWKVEEHQKGGKLTWDPAKVSLSRAESQKNGSRIEGNKLRKELAKKPVLNACVLDYLLDHPYLIPKEWIGWCVFFWGTIYHGDSGRLCVRYLHRHIGCWYWHSRWLVCDWSDHPTAAVSAS